MNSIQLWANFYHEILFTGCLLINNILQTFGVKRTRLYSVLWYVPCYLRLSVLVVILSAHCFVLKWPVRNLTLLGHFQSINNLMQLFSNRPTWGLLNKFVIDLIYGMGVEGKPKMMLFINSGVIYPSWVRIRAKIFVSPYVIW